MPILPLITQPNSILRAENQDLPVSTLEEFLELGEKMKVAMIEYNGIGLAAPQIGENLNLFVINKEVSGGDDHLVLCNPEIIFRSKRTNVMEEGCLSCPHIFGDVRRPDKVRVRAYTLDGQQHTYKAKGLLAKVFQHEIDHLQGRLIIDKFE